jgi:hypothetical protein
MSTIGTVVGVVIGGTLIYFFVCAWVKFIVKPLLKAFDL